MELWQQTCSVSVPQTNTTVVVRAVTLPLAGFLTYCLQYLAWKKMFTVDLVKLNSLLQITNMSTFIIL